MDPDDDAAFHAWYEAVDAAQRDLWSGRPGWQKVELRAEARAVDNPDEMHPLAVLDGDRVAGAGWVSLPRFDNRHLAYVAVWVPPEQRRRGVGSALVEEAAALARRHRRSTLAAWQDELTHETGSSPGRAFAVHHGFAMVQRNVRRELAVPLPEQRLAALEAEAAGRSTGYRVLTWAGEWPEEWMGARLVFGRAMSTDTPKGELDREDEVWTPERVRAIERLSAAQDRLHLSALVVHQASGEGVAFSEIAVPRGAPELAYQHDTLVRGDHRGHRLGLLVKVANLRSLAEHSPATRAVVTYNAADNPHMIAVNELLGCTVVADALTWQKKVV